MRDVEPSHEPGGSGRWSRPVPTIGDTTSAAARASDPSAWRFDAGEREALAHAIAARRDVRRFRPEPLPDDLVLQLLGAAHMAPSVGHSQPWRFVVVRDVATRERAAQLADRERLAQAAQLDGPDRQHMLDLQLDGLREAPLGIVVCCDRRAAAEGVLGRRTLVDADMWSCACAIENLWLSARASGVGVGWVTFFRPRDLAGLVGLPDGVEPLGWLCVGWPDERPPEPGLERAGWSTRLALDEVVIDEHWSRHPSPPPHVRVRAVRSDEIVATRDDLDNVLAPPSSLGVLDRAVDRVVALDRGDTRTGTMVLVFGRHGVSDLGVSGWEADVAEDVLRAARCGAAIGVVAARSAGLAVQIVDTGARTLNLRDRPAMSVDRARSLVDEGIAMGAAAAAIGVVALGEVGIGNTTVAAALAAALLDLDPLRTVGLGAGSDSAIVSRKRDVVQQAVERWRRAASTHDPLLTLASLGGGEIAYLAGVTIGAAQHGAPIVLDGFATTVAAIVATRLEPGVATHLIAGQESRERGHSLTLIELGLEPLLSLRIRSGEGVGASLATGVLLNALQIRRDVARTSAPERGRPG